MNIARSVQTAGGIVQLAIIAGVAYVGYRVIKGMGDLPSVTETANKAWWASSFGDLTIKAGTSYGDFLDWYDKASDPGRMDDPTGLKKGGGEYWAPKGAGSNQKDFKWFW